LGPNRWCIIHHWVEYCLTSLILLFIKFVLRVPLRMSDADLLIGDDAIHGEDAYCFHDEINPTLSREDVELGHSRPVSENEDKSPELHKVHQI